MKKNYLTPTCKYADLGREFCQSPGFDVASPGGTLPTNPDEEGDEDEAMSKRFHFNVWDNLW